MQVFEIERKARVYSSELYTYEYKTLRFQYSYVSTYVYAVQCTYNLFHLRALLHLSTKYSWTLQLHPSKLKILLFKIHALSRNYNTSNVIRYPYII